MSNPPAHITAATTRIEESLNQSLIRPQTREEAEEWEVIRSKLEKQSASCPRLTNITWRSDARSAPWMSNVVKIRGQRIEESKSDASATVPELPHQKASVLGSTIEKINHIFAVLVCTSPILMALIGSILSQLRKLALEARHRRTINNFLR